MGERVKVGTVGVDAGMIMIGDPCYLDSFECAECGHEYSWDVFDAYGVCEDCADRLEIEAEDERRAIKAGSPMFEAVGALVYDAETDTLDQL